MMTQVLAGAVTVAFVLITLAMAVALARLLRGPSLPDRVVALDLISTLAIGYIAVTTLASGEHLLLRAAIVLALVSFLGTVAFAGFIRREAGR